MFRFDVEEGVNDTQVVLAAQVQQFLNALIYPPSG